MIITPFGIVFSALLVWIMLCRRGWLLPLLVVSAVLHAPAVIVLGAPPNGRAMGVTPWLVTSLAACLHLTLIVARRRQLQVVTVGVARKFAAGWSGYLFCAILSAFVLPQVFEGLATFTPANMLGIATPPEPLEWRLVNIVQAVNAALIWMTLLYVVEIADEPGFKRRLLIGLGAAFALAIVLSLQQRAQHLGLLPALSAFEASLNPSYAQTMGYWLPHVPRMNWPFSEPSYASAWFAAGYAAGLAAVLFAHRARCGFAMLAVAAFGLLNSMGGTGIASATASTIVLSGVMLAVIWRSNPAQRALARKRIFALAAALTLGVGSLAVAITLVQRDPRFADLDPVNFYTSIILPRINEDEYAAPGALTRAFANETAGRIVVETYGLGAGLGSNRGSNFALAMASNVGILPTLLFFALLIGQLRALVISAPRDISTLLVTGGSLGMLFALLAGIPDLNWPAWWIWIIAGLGLLAHRPVNTKAPISYQATSLAHGGRRPAASRRHTLPMARHRVTR